MGTKIFKTSYYTALRAFSFKKIKILTRVPLVRGLVKIGMSGTLPPPPPPTFTPVIENRAETQNPGCVAEGQTGSIH
jgi:hypothetical protein